MGKANPILDIVVHRSFENRPEVQALREKGHRVTVYQGPDVDIVMLPFAYQYHDVDFEAGYTEATLAAARARRKKKGKA